MLIQPRRVDARPPGQDWTLGDLSERAADCWSDAPAMIFDDEPATCLSFQDVELRSNAIANVLVDAGLKRGDRVAVMLRNHPTFPLTWLALAKIGAQMVPVNTSVKRVDAAMVLGHSHAVAAVAATDLLPLVRECSPQSVRLYFNADGDGDNEVIGLAHQSQSASTDRPATDVTAHDILNVQYTSGTTGMPKGCMLSHSYWRFLVDRLVDEFPCVTHTDVMLTAQPFYYLDPQWNLAVALATGASLVVLDRFHPSTFMERVRHYHVTFFYCVGLMPALISKMPRSETDRANQLRLVCCSGIPPKLHAELEERWGAPWFEIGGMTETGADLYVAPDSHDALVGTGCVGRPYACREARVVDETNRPVTVGETGELVLRGPGMLDGYFEDEEATATVFRGGWFHTGDLVRNDREGRFYYVGRIQEVIRRGGETISAAEVEGVLLAHPAIQMAACVAVPDEVRGQEVKAYVVLQGGLDRDGAPPDELAAYCRARLAYFKVPRYWEYRDRLPLSSAERPAKAQLREEKADLREGAYDLVDRLWRP